MRPIKAPQRAKAAAKTADKNKNIAIASSRPNAGWAAGQGRLGKHHSRVEVPRPYPAKEVKQGAAAPRWGRMGPAPRHRGVSPAAQPKGEETQRAHEKGASPLRADRTRKEDEKTKKGEARPRRICPVY